MKNKIKDLKENEKKNENEKWFHHPALQVLLFFLFLALGASLGIRAASPTGGLIAGTVTGIIASLIASRYWEFREPLPQNQQTKKDILDVLSVYVEGKMKRYSLLFGVNGGAFAIVKLLGNQKDQLPELTKLAGRLSLPALAFGAIVFTAVMITDIWLWGQLMRRQGLGGTLAFTYYGKAILLLIAGLIISGWVLVAMP